MTQNEQEKVCALQEQVRQLRIALRRVLRVVKRGKMGVFEVGLVRELAALLEEEETE